MTTETEDDVSAMIDDARQHMKLVEEGWLSLRKQAIPPNLPPEVVRDLRRTFFAGASHMFWTTMANIVNLDTIDRIKAELHEFRAEIDADVAKERTSQELRGF